MCVDVGGSGCGSIKLILDPEPTLLGLQGLKGVKGPRGVTKQEKT
jgi:hypothetical protein